MYYDEKNGAKNRLGLFSKLTIGVLTFLVVCSGIYLGIDYFAPEIFAMRSSEKEALESKVKNEEVSGEFDFLRIPSIGLERQVVEKNAEGKIQITHQGNSIILSGRYRALGVTPMETVALSPLALADDLETGQMIYLDYNRERAVYEIVEITHNQKPQVAENSGMTIYALSDDGSNALVIIQAKPLTNF